MKDPIYQINNLKRLISSLQEELLRAQEKIIPPKKVSNKEITVPSLYLLKHKVFNRATQVGLSFPCYGKQVKVGTRLAMLYPICEFTEEVPEQKFYPGTVTALIGDPDNLMMKIKWDGGPNGSIEILCGIKDYAKYCIPVPQEMEIKGKII